MTEAMKTSTTTVPRRRVLRNIMTAIPAAVAGVMLAPFPDAELTMLADELSAKAERVKAADAHISEIGDKIDAHLTRLYGKPKMAPPAAVTDARKRFGYSSAWDDHAALADECDAIAERIRILPAAGMAGVAAKATALAWDLYCSPKFEADPDQMDWEPKRMLAFIKEISGMAARA